MAELINKDDSLNTGRKKLNDAIGKAGNADTKSTDALDKAAQSLSQSESTQIQLNNIVIDGDSSVEAAQARVDEKGESHTTLKERIDDGFNKTTAQLAQTATGYYAEPTGGFDSDNINSVFSATKQEDKNMTIKTGLYKIDKKITIDQRVYFEKDVVFEVNDDIDVMEVFPNGHNMNFNTLIIVINVPNYTKDVVTFRGVLYEDDVEYQIKNVQGSTVEGIKVVNPTIPYPFTSAGGKAFVYENAHDEIHLFVTYRNLTGILMEHAHYITSTGLSTGNSAFGSSVNMYVDSWRCSNALTYNDVADNGSNWSDMDIVLKVQSNKNLHKVINMMNGAIASSKIELGLWDFHTVDVDLDNLIDAGSTNIISSTIGGSATPVSRYVDNGNSAYNNTRFDSFINRGNLISTNLWDYIYVFGNTLTNSETFESAIKKIIARANEIGHNATIVLEYGYTSGNYNSTVSEKMRPLTPRVPNDHYGTGMIRVTLPFYGDYDSVFVEFTSTAPANRISVSYTAKRFYQIASGSGADTDSKWTIYGDLYGTTTDRNTLSANDDIRKPTGFKFWDSTLNKPVFFLAGVWRDALGQEL